MEQELRAMLLSTGAGLSTLLGALVVLVSQRQGRRLVTASLGFAAGVMISVSFLELFPNAGQLLQTVAGEQGGMLLATGALVLGILLAAGIDRLVPHEPYDQKTGETPHRNLFRVGMVSALAIALHNLPEGMATFMAGYEDPALGVSVAVAIALHNIPEGISVAMPLYAASGSRRRAVWYTLLSGIAEPVGALIAFLFLRPLLSDTLLGGLFGLVSGIMIYIAIEELIPSSRQYGYDREGLIATFLGICLMPLTLML